MNQDYAIPEDCKFVAYTMVTDSRVYEIVRRSERSLWIRPTKDTDFNRSDSPEGHPCPVILTGQAPDEYAKIVRVGMRKNGSFCAPGGSDYSRLYPARMVEGQPTRRTDYSM